MFGKKPCKKCGEKLEGKWNFCPRCGTILKGRNVFDDFDHEFKIMNKAFGLGKILGGPNIKFAPREDGMNIIITQGTEARPKIKEPRESLPERIPESVEEPMTKLERKGNKQTITIKLPGVKYEDIEIKRLENSIEIRAFIGKKAYFKLIPVPSNASISKTFDNDMLKIEVMR